jgi:hypothetical protein
MSDSMQLGREDVMALCRRYGGADLESEVLAARILTRCALTRIQAALDSPDRRGRWRTLEYLERYLDELMSMIAEPAAPSGRRTPPSGLAGAIAEDPAMWAMWDDYCHRVTASRETIRAQARHRYGHGRAAVFGGVEIRRQAG